MYPQLHDINLRTDYPILILPVYFFLERHDINAPSASVKDYFSVLKTLYKEIIWFEYSGHIPWINETEKFVEELNIVSEKY